MAAKEKKEKVPGEVKCAYCKGTGKHSDATCVVCGGKGTVNVSDMNKKCTYCKGMGYIISGTPCMLCQGTGFTRPVDKQRLF